jgi:prepilin-type N-terminal cleavage/methylation domain-containing protein
MKNFLKQKNKGHQSLSSSKGFTLVESLVAISIFSLSILGMMSVLSQSLGSTTYAKDKIIAAYLAQEGLEYVRNVRDNYVLYNAGGAQAGWNNFLGLSCTVASPCGYNNNSTPASPGYLCSSAGQTCRLYVSNGAYDANPASGLDSGFTRTLVITPIAGSTDERRITSTVSWTQGSGNYNISFTEDVFNWIE